MEREAMGAFKGRAPARQPTDRPHTCGVCGGWPAPVIRRPDGARLCEACAAEVGPGTVNQRGSR